MKHDPELQQTNLSFKNKNGQNVRLVIARHDTDLKSTRDMYVKSFYHNYRNIPIADLNPQFKTIADVENWFGSSFDEEQNLLNKNKIILVQAILNNEVIGMVSFEKLPFENNAVSLRNIAISADHQRTGLGKYLVFSIINIASEITTIFVIVNHLNQIAVKFYENIGFCESKHTREGYDSAKYIGLEWHKK